MAGSTSAERQAVYPMALKVARFRCVVVGGGAVGERKARGLVQAGAVPTVVGLEATRALERLARTGKVELIKVPYAPKLLAGARLVFAATDDSELNQEVAADARRVGAFVDVTDDPDGSDFHSLGYARRGDFMIAVGTGGRSPAFTRSLRKQLEKELLPDLENHLRRFEAWRAEVERRVPTPRDRTYVWRKLERANLLAILMKDGPTAAESLFKRILDSQAGRAASGRRARPASKAQGVRQS